MVVIFPAEGDWGATFTFSMKKRDNTTLDISTATEVKGWLTKPDGTPVEMTGTKVGDGSDGQFTVTVGSGTLDQPGSYILEPEVIFANGAFAGTLYRFKVRPSARE